MTDVFISYANLDRARASMLAGALAARGWSVWWDRKIRAGQTFDEVIERELETAAHVVVLWSNDSISSEWVKNEAAVAAQRGVLVPALIDRVKVPLEFRRRQTVDLIGWDGRPDHAGFQSLCEALEDPTAARAAARDVSPKLSGFRIWRNRKWSVAAIAALLVVSAGTYLLFRDSSDDQRAKRDEGKASESRSKASGAAKAPEPHATARKRQDGTKALPTGLQSSEKGVLIDITAFEKAGELVTMELIFRNTSGQKIMVCSRASGAKLIDELTGESWRALHVGGPLKGCQSVSEGDHSGVWIKFKVPGMETRRLSFSLPTLPRAPEVTLRQPSGK